jgi:hypothetical protein
MGIATLRNGVLIVPIFGHCPDCPAYYSRQSLTHFDKSRQVALCRECFSGPPKRKEIKPKSICPKCRRGPRRVHFVPKLGARMCDWCRHKSLGILDKRRKRLCQECRRFSKTVHYRFGEKRICLTCHCKHTGYKPPLDSCPECGFERRLTHRHWEMDCLICRPCYKRHRAQAS